MIIWIDGVYGVGKTTIAYSLKEKLEDSIVAEADEYWLDFVKHIIENTPKGRIPAFGGLMPQNNIEFIKSFRKNIEEKHEANDVIVDMALSTSLCKESLIDYFHEKKMLMFHFILEVDEASMRARVAVDLKRKDKTLPIEEFPLANKFLKSNYENAIRINTENRTCEEILQEMIEHISC